MSRKKTNEEFLKEIKERNPNIKPLENYVSSGVPIKFKCLKCGHKWKTTPMHVIEKNEKRRTSCPECSNKIRTKNMTFTREEILDYMKDYPDYEIIDWLNYESTKDKAKFKHLTCGREFKMTVNNFKNGERCPNHRYDNCKLFELKRSRLLYEKIIESRPDLDDYEIMDKITKGCKQKIRINHLKCDNEPFKMSVEKFISGQCCKYCSDIYNSKGVKRIKLYLNSNGIKYKQEKIFKNMINPKTNYPLKLDFYLPLYKSAIEFGRIS